MGGRGSEFGGGGGAGVTDAQNKTVNRIIRQTRDLKNEQSRIIDENGNVVLANKGTRHEVAATVGQLRDLMPGAVSIHNHPDGGTFSDADLRQFGYGARQIVVASPEGTYKLTNLKYGTREQANGWYDMRNAMESSGVTKEVSFLDIRNAARKVPAVARQSAAMRRTSEQWAKAREAGKPQATLDRLVARYNKQDAKYKELLHAAERKIETQPYHDFYRKNASKYGFKYEFIKR